MLDEFVKIIKQKFSNNLRSVLFYGSAKEGAEFNDFDIIVILQNKINPLSDLSLLKEIKNQEAGNIDLQLIYSEEIFHPSMFSLDTHGSFILKILKNAKVLEGENPFTNFEPESKDLKRSVLAKIQYYIFRARQAFMGYEIYSKDKGSNFHQKRILLAIQDILFYDNVVLEENILNQFKRRYPSIFTDNELIILSDKSDASLGTVIPMYEKLYSLALIKAKKEALDIKKPLWWKKGDIFIEYLLPDGDQNKTIILCDGLPGIPYQRELMNEFMARGYAIFFPRYKGTWESGGNFLEVSPAEDINEICNALSLGADINGKQFKASFLVLLGASFGGAVALSAAANKNVEKVIALSPVTDFTKTPSMDSLGEFLKNMFSGAYRFDDKNWKLLAMGKLLNPVNFYTSELGKKIIIFGGANDKDITPQALCEFCDKFSIVFNLESDIGHISFSKVKGALFDKIFNLM
ncbi:MAG: hypothetical protein NTV77_03425 [Candidatus Azambacteria bacterium]|nr:hypothetical protein [Candidatus Azambacteria bacterium]